MDELRDVGKERGGRTEKKRKKAETEITKMYIEMNRQIVE